MTWVNSKIEAGIGAMRLMIPLDFFRSVGIEPPEMTKNPEAAVVGLIQELETFAGLTPGCQGWLYDRAYEYQAAVLSVAHIDLPKINYIDAFPVRWVKKRSDGTWGLFHEGDPVP